MSFFNGKMIIFEKDVLILEQREKKFEIAKFDIMKCKSR